MSGKTKGILLLAIVILATALRFWRLSDMPPGFYHDEAYNGLDAISLANGATFPIFYEGWELYAADAHAQRAPTPTRWPIFFEGNYGREPAHIYLMALSVKLLGATPLAIRAVPAVAGVLSVVTTYVAAVVLVQAGGFGRKPTTRAAIPLLAAFFVATLFAAVHFSRFGLRAMLFVPVETLAVACFWRGLATDQRRSTWAWFVVAGLLIGAGLYVYAAARLFPLVFGGFMAVWLLRDRDARRRYWQPFAALTAAAVLIAAPLLLYFARYPYFLLFRTAYVANKGAGTVADRPWLTWLLNVGRVVRGLFWQGETHLRHNLPGRPYLDIVQAGFFAVGAVGVWRGKSRRAALFVAWWLVVMLLPTVLSGDAPHFGRMTGAVPVVAIIAAVGVGWLLDRGWAQRRVVVALLLGLLLGSAGWTWHSYFTLYGGEPRLSDNVDGFYLPDWQLGQALARESAETALYLSPHQPEMATIYFALGGDTQRLRTFDGSGTLLPLGWAGAPVAYAAKGARPMGLDSAEWRTLPEASASLLVIPNAPHIITAPDDDYVPVRLHETLSLLGYTYSLHEESLSITLTWLLHAPLASDYTAFVHLLDADGNIVAQVDRQPFGYPTTDWRVRERIQDTFTIPLPAAPDGASWRVRTGFYDLATQQPLGAPVMLPPISTP